jgi:hypothetical protein
MVDVFGDGSFEGQHDGFLKSRENFFREYPFAKDTLTQVFFGDSMVIYLP